MFQKHGALVSPLTRQRAKERSNELNVKGQQTIMNKYGVTNVSQLPSVKDKKTQTSMRKYGVNNVSQKHILPEMLAILHSKPLLDEFMKGKGVREAALLLGINFTTVYKQLAVFDIGNIRTSSSYETEIEAWLQQYPVTYVRNNRRTIAPLELDFFFPDLNVAIEFNGLAHHSEFLGSSLRNNKTSFRNYHRNKWKLCVEKGITLLSIFEDEWNTRKDVVKRTILRLLKISPTKAVGARSLRVTETINKTQVIAFLNKNHWQGGIRNFQVGFEAYLNDQLVGVMTFSYQDSEYILTRYCIGEGNFPGLFSKMMKAFVNKYQPVQITTFSDNRYATGQIYQNNGFTHVADLQEGYAVTDYTNRWHRSNFQKKLIQRRFNVDVLGKTETQLLHEVKLDRIWDCGKKKWQWTRKQGT